MYYLRKEPYEQIIPALKKTDGTSMQERRYMTEDRALYKANSISRLFRRTFTGDKQPGFHLYKVKKLSTIMKHHKSLLEYCGEWFDVYDENGKVNIDGEEN